MKMRIASTWFSRVKGMLVDREHPDPGEVLLLTPCRDIHTVGMRFPIDVAFVDEDGCVRLVYEGLGPGKRLFCEAATAVLERPSPTGSIYTRPSAEPWFQVGEQIELGAVGAEEMRVWEDLPEEVFCGEELPAV